MKRSQLEPDECRPTETEWRRQRQRCVKELASKSDKGESRAAILAQAEVASGAMWEDAHERQLQNLMRLKSAEKAEGLLYGQLLPEEIDEDLEEAADNIRAQLSAPKSQRFLRFAIAMPIADPRNRSDFRDKRKQYCILSGPLNRLNAILSLLHPLDR